MVEIVIRVESNGVVNIQREEKAEKFKKNKMGRPRLKKRKTDQV